jgi:hypothetical protein
MRLKYWASPSKLSQLSYYFQTLSFGQLQPTSPRPEGAHVESLTPSATPLQNVSQCCFSCTWLPAAIPSQRYFHFCYWLGWVYMIFMINGSRCWVPSVRLHLLLFVCIPKGSISHFTVGEEVAGSKIYCPTPFFIRSRREIIFCLQSLSRVHYTAQKRWKLTPWDNWEFCCNFQTERQTVLTN